MKYASVCVRLVAVSDRTREQVRDEGVGPPRRVVFLMLPRVHALDLAGPLQAFWEASAMGAGYRHSYVAVTSEIETAQGLRLAGLQPLPEVGPGDIVVVPGMDSASLDDLAPRVPAAWLRLAAQRGATVCSICSGAFALGHAGLLDGRRCTTHWSVVERLRRDFPAAIVERECLFVRDAPILTSAGLASGIDLALSMIEQDHGPMLAAHVARELVVFLRRNGSRDQRSVFLDYRTHLNPGVHRVQDWLAQHPERKASLDELASIAGMSPRNLTRRFRELTGITLKEFAHRLKLEVAGALLNDPSLTVDSVAERCGFEDGRQLRRLWNRYHGASPRAWRDAQLPV
jgi:transcriptional regulator GlxA family with amidase domain